ncbi:MAG: ExbD/TolR family protein [Elusimicrobiota bacterium]
MQKQSDKLEEPVSEVNIVPLADVTLVLLILLMVISPMALQSMIQVQASQAVASRTKQAVSEKPLFVDVTTTGFTVNNNIVSTEYELFRSLQKMLAGKSDKTVLISSAADVPYENVVKVLDLVKQSGAISLSLVPRKMDTPS